MATTTRHNLTTGLLLVVLGVPIAIISAIPRFQAFAQEEQLQTERRAPYEQARDAQQEQANLALVGSGVPLALVKANRCIPIVDAENPNNEIAFEANVEVVATTVDGKPLPAGSLVCNRMGHAATVGVNHRLVDIQYTSLEALAEYQTMFDLLKDTHKNN